jgi:rod shape-determining protein MreB
MAFKSLFSLFSSDLAIDLGTANTLVYAKGRGIVVSEPSIVAINKVTNQVEAVGRDAKEMLGRTPGNIVAIRPMKDGVIANFEVTEKNAAAFYPQGTQRQIVGATARCHRHTSRDHAGRTPRRRRFGLSAPKRRKFIWLKKRWQRQSAQDFRLPNRTEIWSWTSAAARPTSPLSLSGIVYSRAVRVAGNEMDEAITQFIKRKYNLLIGERTAEAIKIALGSAFPLEEPLSMEVRGRNLIEGIPKDNHHLRRRNPRGVVGFGGDDY